MRGWFYIFVCSCVATAVGNANLYKREGRYKSISNNEKKKINVSPINIVYIDCVTLGA